MESEIGANNTLVVLQKNIAGLSASTLERFVVRTRRALRLRDTVDVLVTGNRDLRALNRQFRGKDKATDVLSFPALPAPQHRRKKSAGELAISADIARENAKRLGHPVAEEIKILVLHGILHLAGFDHEQDQGEMARKELSLRRRLKLEAGLLERTEEHAGPGSKAAGRKRTVGPRRSP
jgi:probable rRNA maturation factor